jgi:hypothetical protein
VSVIEKRRCRAVTKRYNVVGQRPCKGAGSILATNVLVYDGQGRMAAWAGQDASDLFCQRGDVRMSDQRTSFVAERLVPMRAAR